jgi:hypothetical protein
MLQNVYSLKMCFECDIKFRFLFKKQLLELHNFLSNENYGSIIWNTTINKTPLPVYGIRRDFKLRNTWY